MPRSRHISNTASRTEVMARMHTGSATGARQARGALDSAPVAPASSSSSSPCSPSRPARTPRRCTTARARGRGRTSSTRRPPRRPSSRTRASGARRRSSSAARARTASGEFLYQDWLFDDHGARGVRDPGDPRFDNDTFSAPYGTYTYPTDKRYAGNAADLVELRIRAARRRHRLPPDLQHARRPRAHRDDDRPRRSAGAAAAAARGERHARRRRTSSPSTARRRTCAWRARTRWSRRRRRRR